MRVHKLHKLYRSGSKACLKLTPYVNNAITQVYKHVYENMFHLNMLSCLYKHASVLV